jgi:hypothetical protein
MSEELVKRLADEAELTCDALPPWMTDYGYSKESICKFAALVAEECAKEAEAAFRPTSDFKGTNLYFERCARVIRAKFPLAPANTPATPPQ